MSEVRTYTCDNCHETFIDGWSEEEALDEARRLGMDLERAAILCEPCFRQMMRWYARTRP